MRAECIRVEASEPVAADLSGTRQGIKRGFSQRGMGSLLELKDDLFDVQHSIEDLKSFGGAEVAKKAEKLIRSLKDFKPSITMIGQIKSGKTSLVNAMVGMPDLLPADVNPWTSVVTSLHLNTPLKDDDPRASFQFFDQDEWEHLVEKGGRLGELSSRAGADEETQKVREQVLEMREKSKARLGRKFELLLGQTHNYKYLDDALVQRYVCMGDDFGDPEMHDPQGQFADITKSADLFLNAPGIPIPMCIRDTPGVNDTFMMREQVTINALRSSRICVVVLSATQALNSVDLGLIRLIANVKSREVIIFVNRIDELANPATEVQEIEESIHRTLAEHNGPANLKVLFGSAYWGNMALKDEVDHIVPDSAAALEDYAGGLGQPDAPQSAAGVWEMSGIPQLFTEIGDRVVAGEGREILSSVRRRALNHLQGLQASCSVVSLRLDDTELEMMDSDTLAQTLEQNEERLISELDRKLNELFQSYEQRVDQAHKRFLDRAVESLLHHLERKGQEELWQYSPDGLRVLLRSSYHMLSRKAEKATREVFSTGSASITETYQNMLSVTLDGFKVTPPEAPSFPPPATLGQTIALDMQTSWWSGWWQRRKGYRSYADEFHKLIEAETAPMITDMKVTQTEDIRKIAIAELTEFLAEQRSILTDVSQKSLISRDELNNLFGITEQQERDALFEILFEEFAVDDLVLEEEDSRPKRPARPTRPVAITEVTQPGDQE
ncbi:dynamin family protein [Marivita hallyeonensis]|uniref:Dynamin family protein n=1 Tax=Marivita hallyeonensis TaxID=996342 RepID=A0A1M5LS11_9RHOB|nr:dynamin family protein [Marivita hallyeonensis]SHG67419.1 Dynamin family protein [Marivita hallyeonensis]